MQSAQITEETLRFLELSEELFVEGNMALMSTGEGQQEFRDAQTKMEKDIMKEAVLPESLTAAKAKEMYDWFVIEHEKMQNNIDPRSPNMLLEIMVNTIKLDDAAFDLYGYYGDHILIAFSRYGLK